MKFEASLKASPAELVVHGVCPVCCYAEELRVI